ncbi:type IV conjugative transfer system pilin TraA [Pasteurella multocida]|uniref:type IV conjugative transfer system pilin TraA n=1 Tax=Pasteurella multocida TaxID=747 RepID=UPI0014813449|nr:type IV conjugative transfer system pilin TraA [Pasteurella multocida]NNH97771.1 TraA fimbrial protein precursor [Pasteurella multocida]NNI42886.1 TraA fimbrial protein precursor [Pasteurella multocida]
MSTSLTQNKYLAILAACMVAVALSMMPSLAFAKDLVAPGKKTITDTFGSGSTVIYILYVLEIVSALFLYIKTKNLAVFGGLVAVLIFTNVAFTLFT